MRSFIFLSLLTTFATAQLDQHLSLRVDSFTRLFIVSAAIFDENQPLRIEVTGPVINTAVENIAIDRSNSLDPVLIEVFHPEIFERFPNLRTTDYEFVRMRRFGANSFPSCPQTFINIWWRGNFHQEVPRRAFGNCRTLTTVNLAENQITRVDPDAFLDLPELRWLTLTGNRLTTITPDILQHSQQIITFTGSDNPISYIEPRSFPIAIQHILLSNISITELHPDMLVNNGNLQTLDLRRNSISEFPPGIFRDLTLIRSFWLDFTNIRRLNKNSFSNHHPQITTIDLQFSGLNEIEPGFFDDLPSLWRFDGLGNLCVNETVRDFHLVNVNEVFEECFRNW